MQLGALGGLICSSSGTLGVLVRRPDAADVFLLSCSHVIANCGQFPGSFADLREFRKVVQQPVSSPCDAQANRIGLLQDDFSVVVPQSQGVTNSDRALALLDPAVAAETTSSQAATGNSIRDFATEAPSSWQYGMVTHLLGAMNPGASGFVIGYNGDTPEYITFPEVGMVQFAGLVRYATRSEEGDSGAPVVDEQNRLLGIHVGGSRAGIAVFYPVGPYLLQKGLVLA
jgi:hypothetical protein